MPVDRNKIAKESLNRMRKLEKETLRCQFENHQRKKNYVTKKIKIEEKRERERYEQDLKVASQRQIQQKLKDAQEMSKTLIKQMQERFNRNKVEARQRREDGGVFFNKYKDKMLRSSVKCTGCKKMY